MKLNSIPELIEDIQAGRMVILMDDEDRENEGDLIMAASRVRAEDINFMARFGRGLICLPLTRDRCEQLALPLMVNKNDARFATNFTVSIEAAEGITTGISAQDRAHTVRTAVSADAGPGDISLPGHIFPLMASPGGVLSRAGHTEASVDLVALAGLDPSAVLVEILNEDGTMARRPQLEIFAREHGLKLGTIADLIRYRLENERTVELISRHAVETDFGPFMLHSYRDTIEGRLHWALLKGEAGKEHADDDSLLRRIQQEPEPAITPSGDNQRSRELRTYGIGAQIIADLGVRKMRVLSAPTRLTGLSGFGLEVVDYVEPAGH
jgi:3,4-dihydroxy 2-butanone 4-phosphate synthase/GTP cyclohydrolase II